MEYPLMDGFEPMKQLHEGIYGTMAVGVTENLFQKAILHTFTA